MDLTYLCNAGVLVSGKSGAILIDGLTDSRIAPYRGLHDRDLEAVLAGKPPFDTLRAAIFTHTHPDHFSFNNIKQLLTRRPEIIVVFPESESRRESILYKTSAISRLNVLSHKCQGETIELSLDGFQVTACATVHDGKEYCSVNHYAYLVCAEGKKIFHSGDSAPNQGNYSHLNLPAKGIDLAILPFPYVGLTSAAQVIARDIRPRALGILHFPLREYDINCWAKNTYNHYSRIQDMLPTTTFLYSPGTHILI